MVDTTSSASASSHKETLMRRATLLSMVVAGILILAKFVGWWISGSLSVFSSLADSGLDLLASSINFLAVRYALMPPDQEHRFGHGKAEPIAALAQAIFIASSGIYILFEGLHRLAHPVPIQQEGIAIGIMVFSVAVTGALVTYQRYVARQTDSMVVETDSLHYVMDIFTNASVILALLLTGWLGWSLADPIFALAIAAYIGYSAWEVAHKAFHQLMDHEFSEDEREAIKEIIRSHPGALGFHDLKTRQSGIYRFIQFNLDLDENLSFREAHAITHSVEAKIKALHPHAEIIIHQDPVSATGEHK